MKILKKTYTKNTKNVPRGLFYDLNAKTKSEKTIELIDQWCRKLVSLGSRPFDLSRAPLFGPVWRVETESKL